MKRRIFSTVFLWLMLASLVLSAAKKYGDKCKVDADCGTVSMVCFQETNICKQKPLFPMHGREIGGMVLLICLSMFAVVAGFGGGTFFVPLLQLIFGMSAKETTALSNGFTMFSSFSKLLVSLRQKDPDCPRRSLINYDVIVALNPTLLLGSAIGAILINFMAEVMPMFFFVILMSYSIMEAFKKTRSLWKKELEDIKSEKLRLDPAEKQAVSKGTPDFDIPQSSRRPSIKIELQEGVDPKRSAEGNQNEELESPQLLMSPTKTISQDPSSPSDFSPLTKRSSTEEVLGSLALQKPMSLQIHECEDPEEPPVEEEEPAAQPTTQDLALVEEKGKIEDLEARNWTLPNTLSIFGSFVLTGIISILRGGNGVKSPVGINPCSSGDWVLFSVLGAGLLLFSYFGSAYVLQKQSRKHALEFSRKNEMLWDKKTVVKGWLFTIFVGAGSSISGLGGGSVMTPFLYSIEVMPRSASATSLLTIFFGRIVATILNYVSGVLPLNYLLFIGAFILVGGVVSDHTSTIIINKFKRQSFIAGTFVLVMFLCLILFFVSSGLAIKTSLDAGKSIFQFDSYCK